MHAMLVTPGTAVTVEVLRAELEVVRAEQAKVLEEQAKVLEAGQAKVLEEQAKVLEAVQERTNARKSKGFSSVGASEAEQLLHVLGIPETDGNQLAPITVPEECPTCSGFDYSLYANETAGTAALLQHHQEQLQRMGVTFGRSGYKVRCFSVVDLHQHAWQCPQYCNPHSHANP